MTFAEKADYAGHYDAKGIPMLDYHGRDRASVQSDCRGAVGIGELQPASPDGGPLAARKAGALRGLAAGESRSEFQRSLGLESSF